MIVNVIFQWWVCPRVSMFDDVCRVQQESDTYREQKVKFR